jgi:hypothetical protein
MSDLHKNEGNEQHEHEHEHEHSHDCHDHNGCAHEHEQNDHQHDNHLHNHEQLYADPNEVPAVFSQTVEIKLQKEVSAEILKKAFISWLSDLQTAMEKRNIFIGHLKTFIEYSPEESLWLSTTGGQVSVKEIPEASKSQVSSFKINITAIVFKTDEGTLKELV